MLYTLTKNKMYILRKNTLRQRSSVIFPNKDRIRFSNFSPRLKRKYVENKLLNVEDYVLNNNHKVSLINKSILQKPNLLDSDKLCYNSKLFNIHDSLQRIQVFNSIFNTMDAKKSNHMFSTSDRPIHIQMQIRNIHTFVNKYLRNVKLHVDESMGSQDAVDSKLKSNINIDTVNHNIDIGDANISTKVKTNCDNSNKNPKLSISRQGLKEILYPKNILHNFFNIASEELEVNIKIAPSYSISNNKWSCTYQLQWPENKKITKVGHNKKEASHKAAEEAIRWLKHCNKIDVNGRPILEQKTNDTNKLVHILKLDNATINKFNWIHDRFKNNLLQHFTLDINNNACENNNEVAGLENPWPMNKNYMKKLNSSSYLAKEPVELPIQEFRDNIINMIKTNRVTIIKGEPGCGKSIRVPQYILEACAEREALGEPCKIIVTQPRRIAAVSLAERVSYERGESVGKIVGYQVRFNTNFNKTGRILYCTTGILLRRLQSDPTLSDCTHIVLDEAHERDINTDLLMTLLRNSLQLNPKLKLIVMSATISAEIFKAYFDDASTFHVKGLTYPVETHFIEDCKSLNLDQTIKMCEEGEPQVVVKDVVTVIKHIHASKPEGAILCFLPGWEEISSVAKSLPTMPDMTVLCLHSKLNMIEQRKVFSNPPPGVRKVILATNIAETSVTINDIVYIVDTGMQKQTKFDSEKGIRCIEQEWISQANVKQRKGRAGRVRPGESYHLYTQAKMSSFMEYPIPEILRISLVKIVLDSKVYNNNMRATEFLNQLPTPPHMDAVTQAVNELENLELLDENENLTPLGRTLSKFQMEPKFAKTIANAIIFKCATPILDIITLFSEETNVFQAALSDKDMNRKVKCEFSKTSDHLAMMKMFEKWLEYVENDDKYMADVFCTENNLINARMMYLQKLREVYFDYIYRGFNKEVLVSDELSDSDELVKAVLAADAGGILTHTVKSGNKKKNMFLTSNNHKATFTSDCVNFKRSNFASNFMVYLNETRHNIRRITTLRESSLIPLLSVLLFKNDKLIIDKIPKTKYSDSLKSDDQVMLYSNNSKIKCICDRSQALALINCKDVLKAGIAYYTTQLTSDAPRNEDIDKEWQQILNVLNRVLLSQKI